MILGNLFRRKGRTIVTIAGICIGVAVIVALGAAAQGMRAGFSAMAQGSQADLVLNQTDTLTVILSSGEEAIADQLRTWPEATDVDGVIISEVQTEAAPVFYIFGHDSAGFAIAHFRIVEGQSMTVRRQGIVGWQATQVVGLDIGDTIRGLLGSWKC